MQLIARTRQPARCPFPHQRACAATLRSRGGCGALLVIGACHRAEGITGPGSAAFTATTKLLVDGATLAAADELIRGSCEAGRARLRRRRAAPNLVSAGRRRATCTPLAAPFLLTSFEGRATARRNQGQPQG